ncbi:M23 family metallopeptidase [Kordiimonas aestuarii]|uniref:M23 family metallopeptidase n=1 Tax=Kordiimonas aestuarii TaxID=1005925 RepID=UPI0021D18D06|nr:M23 family metallopeptidase [Kordiimonas aestuarii]
MAVIFMLSACSTGGYVVAPADIPAVGFVRNAPRPIPWPKTKPKPPVRYASTTPQTATTSPARSSGSSSRGDHIVRKGETLYAISRRYDVPVRDLVSANSLRAPYTLAIGQRLTVPSAQIHTVAKGETGYSISRSYGVTVSALMNENGIRPPYTLAVGQTLRLPGGASSSGVTAASASPRIVRPPQTVGRSVPRTTPPPRSSSGFDWPVAGRLASRFGPKQDGLHNDGINILARQGTPVKASEAGVVVYASNALEGYGNLLLVKHAGGWITAYAHNERLLVRQGEQVSKGQVIARVGNTGGVTDPQLHFEIRKGRQALDPLRYLSKMTASADN